MIEGKEAVMDITEAPTADIQHEEEVKDGENSSGETKAPEGGSEEKSVDYTELMASDLAELKREFPELSATESLTDIKNPLRYAALRDIGLSPTEAYLAARGKTKHDTRSHLTGGIPKPAGAQGGSMPRSELEGARELFYGMSDSEIQGLWRRVTK